MKKTFFFIILFALVGSVGYTQVSDSLKRDFENKKLLIKNGRYTVGQQTYRFSKLQPQFEFSKQGLNLYKSAKGNLRAGNTFNLFAAGAYIAAAAMAINDYRGNQTAYLLTLGGGGFMQVVSIPFYSTARKRMRHAVFVRNKDLLIAAK